MHRVAPLLGHLWLAVGAHEPVDPTVAQAVGESVPALKPLGVVDLARLRRPAL